MERDSICLLVHAPFLVLYVKFYLFLRIQKKTVVIFRLWKRDLTCLEGNFYSSVTAAITFELFMLYVFAFRFEEHIRREAEIFLTVFSKEHRTLPVEGTLKILGQLTSI